MGRVFTSASYPQRTVTAGPLIPGFNTKGNLCIYLPGYGLSFSWVLTTKMTPQCRALTGALHGESPGPVGAMVANDRCIMEPTL